MTAKAMVKVARAERHGWKWVRASVASYVLERVYRDGKTRRIVITHGGQIGYWSDCEIF